MFEIRAYFGQDHNGHGYGLAENMEVSDFSDMEEAAHCMICNYGIVEVKCVETGKTLEIEHDSYFENFEGEFPVSFEGSV